MSHPSYPRSSKLADSVRRIVAESLQRAADPRLRWITITEVELSYDLSRAKIYYEIGLGTYLEETVEIGEDELPSIAEDRNDKNLGSAAESKTTEGESLKTSKKSEKAKKNAGYSQDDIARALNKARGYFRGVLAKKMVSKRIPELHFHIDTGAENLEALQRALSGKSVKPSDKNKSN